MNKSNHRNRVIRILITGLTMGMNMFSEGDLVKEQDATEDLKALADGKPFLGRRWAEWVKSEDKTADKTENTAQSQDAQTPEASEPEASQEVDKTENADELPELPPNVVGVSLEEMVLDLVRAGKTKTEVKTELGKLETVTQREASDKFDELLATGRILAGEAAGSYSVAE